MICFLLRRDFIFLLVGSRNQEWTTAAHSASAHPSPAHWSEHFKGRPHGETEDHLFPMLYLLIKVINEVGLHFQSSMFYVSF